MTRLKEGHLIFRRGDDAPAGRRLRPVLLLLIFVSAALMLLSRFDHSILGDVRWQVASWMTPVIKTAMVPVEPLREIGRTISRQADLQDEVERLKKENQKLESWQWRARQLEAKLSALEAFAKVVPEQKLDFITSRVIADSGGAFVHNVTIDAGRNHKVKSGYPVINDDGLIGRVVDVGPTAARVLLATDLNSRIPVVVGPHAVKAILAGDNSANPRLIYIPDGEKVSSGDDVSSSGTGGLFPAGLRLGTVTDDNAEAPRVALRANLDRLTYVGVLFYNDPSADMTDDLLSRKAAMEVKHSDERAGP
ncbi:MAG: rod shape-determining protein MreC [Hyphomicrobium sp.]|uniref:rod shape-determining protein MreC n=1 Tax=Hyphomicrobium sp. TaxID=82 RepID=UPI0039E38657